MSNVINILKNINDYVNWSDPFVWLAIFHITFNPMFWNISARLEYKQKLLSKIFGSTKTACYALAVTTFTIGITRNITVIIAVTRQLSLESYLAVDVINYMKYGGIVCIIAGLVLAISSMVRLGVTGTYLGDYFGLLKDERVTVFPYNVVDNPMYVGSSIAFLGLAITKMSPIGFIFTAYIYIVYRVALRFEEPFTDKIYNQRDQAKEIKAH